MYTGPYKGIWTLHIIQCATLIQACSVVMKLAFLAFYLMVKTALHGPNNGKVLQTFQEHQCVFHCVLQSCSEVHEHHWLKSAPLGWTIKYHASPGLIRSKTVACWGEVHGLLTNTWWSSPWSLLLPCTNPQPTPSLYTKQGERKLSPDRAGT